jgi:hypothetical protein
MLLRESEEFGSGWFWMVLDGSGWFWDLGLCRLSKWACLKIWGFRKFNSPKFNGLF